MVREQIKGTRITVDLANQRLYRAVKVLAAAQGRPLREVVAEALRDWVEKQEDLEDAADFLAAEGEPGQVLEQVMKDLPGE